MDDGHFVSIPIPDRDQFYRLIGIEEWTFVSTHRNTLSRFWQEIPEVETLIDELVLMFSEASLKFWPNWYQRVEELPEDGEQILDPEQGQFLGRLQPVWYALAAQKAEVGLLPLVPTLMREVQIRQLAQTFGDRKLTVLLGGYCDQPKKEQTLMAAAEWLDRIIEYPIQLAMPKKAASRRAA